MTGEDIRDFFKHLGLVVLYTGIATALVLVVFEIMNRRYELMREVFEENSVAAGVLAGAFVFGIFYTVTQLVLS